MADRLKMSQALKRAVTPAQLEGSDLHAVVVCSSFCGRKEHLRVDSGPKKRRRAFSRSCNDRRTIPQREPLPIHSSTSIIIIIDWVVS